MTMTELSPQASLREARIWMSYAVEDGGTTCPCCDQFAKTYHRKVTSGMARKLIVMDRMYGSQWFNLPLFMRQLRFPARDEGALAYWGLIEEATEKREDGGRAGWWRVTARGARFVRNQEQVPKYAVVYNGTCRGFVDVDDRVSIIDALGTRFSYAELMAR